MRGRGRRRKARVIQAAQVQRRGEEQSRGEDRIGRDDEVVLVRGEVPAKMMIDDFLGDARLGGNRSYDDEKAGPCYLVTLYSM